MTIYAHYPELHDFITQAEGSFMETFKGIKNIVDEGCFIRTNTIIIKSNMEYLPEIAKFIISLSVNDAKLTFPHGIGMAKKNFELVVPRFSEIKHFLHEAVKWLKQSSVNPLIEAVPPCFLIGFERYYADYIADRKKGLVPVIKKMDFYLEERCLKKFIPENV